MGRFMGIDYGTKRVGISVSDPSGMFAQPHSTVGAREVLAFVLEYAKANPLEGIVIGLPKNLMGDATDATPHVEGFVRRLAEAMPATPLHRVDERYTSKMASAAILQSGKGKMARRDKALIDSVSAAIILQSYLDYRPR